MGFMPSKKLTGMGRPPVSDISPPPRTRPNPKAGRFPQPEIYRTTQRMRKVSYPALNEQSQFNQ